MWHTKKVEELALVGLALKENARLRRDNKRKKDYVKKKANEVIEMRNQRTDMALFLTRLWMEGNQEAGEILEEVKLHPNQHGNRGQNIMDQAKNFVSDKRRWREQEEKKGS